MSYWTMLPEKHDQVRNHQLRRHDMTMCEESEDLEDSQGSWALDGSILGH
jgi:hypothetical protein